MIRKSIQSFAFLAILMLNVALTSSDNRTQTATEVESVKKELKEKFKEATGNDLTSDTVDTYIEEIYSLLFLGIELQNLEIVEYLVNDLQADVNLANRDGMTPLDIAQYKLNDFVEFDYDKTTVKEAKNAQAIVDVLLKKEAKNSDSYKVRKLYFILKQIKMNQRSVSPSDNKNYELSSVSEFLPFDDDDNFSDDELNDDENLYSDLKKKLIIEKRAENEDDDREEKGDDDYSDFDDNDDDDSLDYELIFDDEILYSDLKQKLITEKRAENEQNTSANQVPAQQEQKIERLLHLLENVKIDLKHKSMGNASSLFKDSVDEFEGFNEEEHRKALDNILYGAATGNIEQIKQGLKYDPSLINAREDQSLNETALHMVASGSANNKDEIINFLISQGADASIMDNEGTFPSEYVIGNPEIKKKLQDLEKESEDKNSIINEINSLYQKITNPNTKKTADLILQKANHSTSLEDLEDHAITMNQFVNDF